jgi:hypothetical protein
MYLTQNLVILCSHGLDADALKSLWEAGGRSVSSAAQITGGSSWLVHWDTEGNAGCLVDVGSGPWPDQNELPGWPLAVGALARAIEGCGDPNLAETAATHASWIGLRLCYNDGVQRPDLDDELQWLLGVAADLADLPAALACFDLEQEALLYLRDLPKANRQPPPLPTEPHWDGAVPSATSTAVTAAAPMQAEATDPMDQILATIEAWQPHRDTIRRHAIGWMKSASFRLSYYDDVHPPLAVQALLHQEMGRRAGEKVWKKGTGIRDSKPADVDSIPTIGGERSGHLCPFGHREFSRGRGARCLGSSVARCVERSIRPEHPAGRLDRRSGGITLL